MPLTDTQIRNENPGLRPVKTKPEGQEIKPLTDGNTKGKTAGDNVAATKGVPRFIATEKPFKKSDAIMVERSLRQCRSEGSCASSWGVISG
jgi:hypothetical protein